MNIIKEKYIEDSDEEDDSTKKKIKETKKLWKRKEDREKRLIGEDEFRKRSLWKRRKWKKKEWKKMRLMKRRENDAKGGKYWK